MEIKCVKKKMSFFIPDEKLEKMRFILGGDVTTVKSDKLQYHLTSVFGVSFFVSGDLGPFD
jgi:hypothetical protein